MAFENDYIQEIDKFIGNKIYSLRLAKGFSRQQLSQVIGVTQQQLSKYEKGTNRISVGRLMLIAISLSENISYFYKDIQTKQTDVTITQHQRMAIEISRNFMKIKNSRHQEAVHILLKSLAA
jgi:transcriptional regulator with XRE-family HTH domain